MAAISPPAPQDSLWGRFVRFVGVLFPPDTVERAVPLTPERSAVPRSGLLPPGTPSGRAPITLPPPGTTNADKNPLPIVGTLNGIGRRQSHDADGLRPGAVLPPTAPEQAWRLQSLDEDALKNLSPARLMVLLTDLSPEVSRALYDYLRMCNSGWTMKAYRAGGKEEDPAAQATLNLLLDRLHDLHGNVDVVLNRLFIGAWLRGAFFSELVIGPDYQFADLATPDPITVRFRRQLDPVRGQIWQIGQVPTGIGSFGSFGTSSGKSLSSSGALGTITGMWTDNFVPLDYPTVRYVPVDPLPGIPYGRALCTPALFTTLFLLGLLHDLRRVVAQQGYPRIDVELVMEQLRLTMPDDDQDDPEKLRTWVEDSIEQVQKTMVGLKPDDTFVHTDVVKVNRPIGTLDSSSLSGIDGIIMALERMATRALKTMPLAMGVAQGLSEANANRQWELQAAGIKSLQHLLEGALSRLFGLALQLAGTPAVVEVRFAELRAAELLRDAQTQTLVIKNAREEYNAGWTTQDEASLKATGHPAAEKEPRQAAINGDIAGQTGNDPAAKDAMGSVDNQNKN